MQSILLSSFLDIFYATLSIVAILVLSRYANHPGLISARHGIIVLIFGLSVWTLYHGFHACVLIVGPFFQPEQVVSQWGAMLDERYRWAFEAITSFALLYGFVAVVRRMGTLLDGLQESSRRLEVERDSRRLMESELKIEAEVERASRRSKSEFIHGLSHEMRTPLNGILGLAGLLSNTDLDADQRKLLSTLEQSAQAMLSKLNDVLDLSRLENGRVELRSAVFRPAELATSVIALFEPLARDKGLQIGLDLGANAETEVLGDPVRIKQVLANLVSNAVKYTPEGSVRVAARLVEGGQQDKLFLEFVVTDTGVGMSPEQVASLESRDAQPITGEAGLGISICHRVLDLMEGEIGIESRLGEGTMITTRMRVRHEPGASESG